MGKTDICLGAGRKKDYELIKEDMCNVLQSAKKSSKKQNEITE